MSWGKNLKRLLDEHRLSAAELSAMTVGEDGEPAFRADTLGNWLRDPPTTPSVDVACAIAKALGVTVEEIYDGKAEVTIDRWGLAVEKAASSALSKALRRLADQIAAEEKASDLLAKELGVTPQVPSPAHQQAKGGT